jgi:hypothetical protein
MMMGGRGDGRVPNGFRVLPRPKPEQKTLRGMQPAAIMWSFLSTVATVRSARVTASVTIPIRLEGKSALLAPAA